MTTISPADEATLRRFAAIVATSGSKAVPRGLRAEVRTILARGHVAAGREAWLRSDPVAARGHFATARRLLEPAERPARRRRRETARA